MEKLETPLTWILAILILGYFALNNCCKVESNDEINNGFSWSSTSNEVTADVEIMTEKKEINVDSIIEAVLQEVDSSIDVTIDEAIKVEDSE